MSGPPLARPPGAGWPALARPALAIAPPAPGARGAEAVPALLNSLQADDLWLRILSAEALAGIGDSARVAVPFMLERLSITSSVNDPRKMEQRYLSFSLFSKRGGLIGRSLDGVDRNLLIKSVQDGLLNEDGRARGAFGSVY